MPRLDDLEIRDLRLLEALGRSKNLAQAARQLDLTASAVSHHVARLEQRLGFAVVEKQGRSWQLSAQAQSLRPLLNKWQDNLAQVQAQWTKKSQRPRIRLTSQCYTAYHWLPALIGEMENQSELSSHANRAKGCAPLLQVRVEGTRKGLAQLQSDDVDLVVGWYDTWPDELATRKLFDDHLALVCAPSHRFAQRSHVLPADLASERLYTYDVDTAMLLQLADQLFVGVPPNRRPQATRLPFTDAIIEFVKANMGVSLLAPWSILPVLQAQQVVVRPFRSPGSKRQWRAFYRANDDQRPIIENTLRALKSLFERYLNQSQVYLHLRR